MPNRPPGSSAGWLSRGPNASYKYFVLPQDYIEIDYPPTQANPFWQVEVRLYGTLKLYLPIIQGALYGVNNN